MDKNRIFIHVTPLTCHFFIHGLWMKFSSCQLGMMVETEPTALRAGPRSDERSEMTENQRSEQRPRLDPEGDDRPGERAFTPTLLVTLAWYLVPGLVYLVWVFTHPAVEENCIDTGCSAMARISTTIAGGWAWLGSSLTASLLVAVLLRLPRAGWRAGVAGTAAAVLGAGLVTVVLRTAGWVV